MSYIAFDRTDRAGLILDIVSTESITQACDFNRVTQFGACAMRFDVPDTLRIDLCFFKRRYNHTGLGFRIRNGVPASPAAMVNNGASNHAINVIAVLHSLVQRFEKERPNALSRYVTIGTLSKAAADAVSRQRSAILINIQFGLM